MGSPAIARKNGKDRIYTRTQGKGGVLRYYADLRDLQWDRKNKEGFSEPPTHRHPELRPLVGARAPRTQLSD